MCFLFLLQTKKRWTKTADQSRCRVQCNRTASGLDSLGRLLYSAVRVEGLKLLLNSSQRVGKFSVVQHNDGLFDPRQQVWRQRLVLINHLLCLNGVIQNLAKEVKDSEGSRLDELDTWAHKRAPPLRLTFPTLLPSTASCFIFEK